MSTNDPDSHGTVGQLGKSGAQWFVNNSSELIAHLPRPGARWRWGETDMSHATLMSMKCDGWILKDGGMWRTPRSTVRHTSDYGRVGRDDVGVEVLELLDIPAVRVLLHVPDSGRVWERSECELRDEELELLVERDLVKELGDGEFQTPERTVEIAERCVDGAPGLL